MRASLKTMNKDVLTKDDEIMIMAVPTYDALIRTVKTLSGNLAELESTFTPAQQEQYSQWQQLTTAFHEFADKAHYARKQ